jgi:hypothetical protein
MMTPAGRITCLLLRNTQTGRLRERVSGKNDFSNFLYKFSKILQN